MSLCIRVANRNIIRKLFSDLKFNTKKGLECNKQYFQSNRKHIVFELKAVVSNNQTHNSNCKIANAFNKRFSSVGNNIDPSIQSDNRFSNTFILNSSTSNSFFFKPTISYPVNQIIMGFKNKTSNINTLSKKIIKSISSKISATLIQLINISISSGHFPTSFKIARIVLVFKYG